MNVTLESVLDPDSPQYEVESPRCIIGRAIDCNIHEPSSLVSQYHCELLIEDETVIVHDLGSRNGTFVNGLRIERECVLSDGDRLVVAFVPYDVHIQPTKQEAPAGLWSRWSQILGPLATLVI